jgi:hypothetical protein
MCDLLAISMFDYRMVHQICLVFPNEGLQHCASSQSWDTNSNRIINNMWDIADVTTQM